MTRALVTQLVEALDACRAWPGAHDECSAAVTAARDYLATEPSGERAELIAEHRELNTNNYTHDDVEALNEWANRAHVMLEADAQTKQVTCQIYGHVVGACVECNTHIEAQPATPDIKALQSNGKGPAPCARFCEANAFEIEIRRLKAEINAQQAKRVPMTWHEADAAYGKSQDHYDLVRAVENHHEIYAPK